MSYFDWKALTKPWRFQPVVQDTVENTKPLTITPIDYVKTNVVQLVIPAFSILSYIGLNAPIIIQQFNYSFSSNLSLVNYNSIPLEYNGNVNYTNVAFCIRYRVGNVVTRYLLSTTLHGFSPSLIPYPIYTGQKILGNFVIEVWQIYFDDFHGVTVQLANPFLMNTGIIYFPCSYEDTGNILQPAGASILSQLETAFPAGTPPISEPQDPSTYWLTN